MPRFPVEEPHTSEYFVATSVKASNYKKNQATTELPRALENCTKYIKINRKASHVTIFG